MNTLKILKDARKLISRPENWTQGAAARDANGNRCRLQDGYSFCAIGAIGKAGYSNDAQWEAAAAFVNANNLVYISPFNDNSTHAEVLAAFDKAIAYAAKRGI